MVSQIGATAHMAVTSMAALRFSFTQWVISHFGDVKWPPHSSDLTAPDLFLRCYMISKVYSKCPVDLKALK